MKYIFFGTPDFAAIILEKLIKSGMPPAALVCNPDRPVGRKKIITPPPAKVTASRYGGIEIFQPEKLDSDFLDKLKKINADFYVVAAYAKILKKELLEIPAKGVIGVHPSLLPKYRGSSPIQSAILNRETETGTCLFLIDEKIDHGPVLATDKIALKPHITYKELEKELAELSGGLLVRTLPVFVEGKIKMSEQDESKAVFTKKFSTEDGFIDYPILSEAQSGNPELASNIDAKVRALNPEPGVYTFKNSKRIKILKTAATEGKLKILEVQYEGKNPTAFKGIL